MEHSKKNQVEKVKEISGSNPLKCMKCGKCSASCPAFEKMDIKPHQFVSYVVNENVDELAKCESLWYCLSCFACVERGPREVAPAKLIEAVRLLAIREQGNNHLRPEQIPGKLDEDMPQQAIVAAFRKYSK